MMKRERTQSEKSRRGLYLPDELWRELRREAYEGNLTISEVARRRLGYKDEKGGSDEREGNDHS